MKKSLPPFGRKAFVHAVYMYSRYFFTAGMRLRSSITARLTARLAANSHTVRRL